jgi:iron(III) transport system substrate-binding protein
VRAMAIHGLLAHSLVLLSIPLFELAIVVIVIGCLVALIGRRKASERFVGQLWLAGAVLFGLAFAVAWGLSIYERYQPAEKVVLYCAQDQVFAEPILAEFTKQTGILVKPVFDSEAVKTVGLANRLLAEREHPVCDVFWGNEEFRTRQLAAASIFQETNGLAVFGQRSRRLVVNTNRIRNQPSPNQSTLQPMATASLITPPASLVELTNSRWRGRVSFAFPLFGTASTHFNALRQHWGESNWMAWCQALAANQPFIEEGNSHVVQRVARGEAWVGLTDSDDIESGRREGLPVAALPLTPELLLIPNTVAIVRNAPHPMAAQKLFKYLRGSGVREQLVAAAALEADTPTLTTLQPDWTALLHDLDRATDQLKEVFRR